MVINMKRMLSILLAVILILTVTAFKSAQNLELENTETDSCEVNSPSECLSTEPSELKNIDSTCQEIKAGLGIYQ
jgi:hypothetical protein